MDLVQHLAPPLGQTRIHHLEYRDELCHELHLRLEHVEADISSDGTGEISLAKEQLVVVGMEERRELLQHGTILVILLLLRVVHLVLQLLHNVDDGLSVDGVAAECAAPGLTVEAGVLREDGAPALLAEGGTEEGPELGGVTAPPAAALEEPAGLDVRTSLGVAEEEGDVLDGDLLALLDVSLCPESQFVVRVDNVPAVVVAVMGHEGEGRVDRLP